MPVKLPKWFKEEDFHTQMVLLHSKEPIGALFAQPYYVNTRDNVPDQHFWVLKVGKNDYRFSMTSKDALSAAALRGIDVVRKAK